MKKFYLGITLLMMSLIVSAAPRSVKEAASLAASFQNEQAQKAGIRRAPRKAADMQLIHEVAKPESSEAALYVFNNPNGGWVIVSADDNAVSILGYSDKGTFDGSKPAVAYMLDYYAEHIAQARPLTDEEKASANAPRRAKAEETAVSPLLEIEGIRWDQGTPYNDLCPIDRYDDTRSATGCAATAASQIMRYWKWPAQGRGKFSYTWKNVVDYDENIKSHYATYDTVLTINYGETTYDWDNMLPQYHTGKYNDAQGHAVAVLMHHAGVSGKMMYGGHAAGGSGAYVNDIGSGMVNNFKYKFDGYYTRYHNKTLKFDSIAKLFSIDLHAGRPIIMSGGGHAYVCDGMDGNGRFHINWGWSGGSDGYYVLSALYPGHEEAVGSDEEPLKYSKDLDFVHGLVPDTLPIHVTNIELNKTTRSLSVNESKELQATITPADATCKGIYWTSSDEKIVSVKGYILMEEWEKPDKDETKAWRSTITGVSAGTAIVSAITYDGDLVASCEVTVTDNGGSTASDTTKLVFNTVFERKHETGSNYISIGLHGDNEYPYMWFKLAADTLNRKIAGYYELEKNGNKINGWTSILDPNHTTTSKSGWVNITCTAEGEYLFEGIFLGEDGKRYQFNDIISLDSINDGKVKQVLTDQAGDGTMPVATITWYALGQIFTTNNAYNNRISLPAGQPEACTNGRVFVGWSANEVEGTNIKPVMAEEGDEVNGDATYYAVYAEHTTPSATPIEVASVKFNHYSGDDDDLNVTNMLDSLMTYDKKGLKKISGINLFPGKSGVKLGTDEQTGWLTLTLEKPAAIKKVSVDAAGAEGGDRCRIRVVAEKSLIDKVQYPAENLEYVAEQPIMTNTIKVAISNKNAYIDGISVMAEDEGIYFNYSTSCEGTGTELPVVIIPANKEGLFITKEHINIDIDEYKSLIYTVAPFGLKDQTVTWTSSDPSIATVSAKGLVLGKSTGTAIITGTSTDGGYIASCEVSVSGEYHQNVLTFTGIDEHKLKSDNRVSIALKSTEGGYYPYMYLWIDADITDWKIAGYYELNNTNSINGWLTEAQYNTSGSPKTNSISGWLNITCIETGKYRFQSQFKADNGQEYIFDYTGSVSDIKDKTSGTEVRHTLTDMAGDGAMDSVFFVSMGNTAAVTYINNGTLVLPSRDPDDCSTMTFMGWTTEEDYNSNIAPTFAKTGDATSADATYYAVYAIKDGDPIVNAEVASVVFKDSQDANSWYDDDYIGNKQVTELMDSYNNITTLHGSWLRPGAHGVRIGGNAQDEYGQDHKGYVQLVMSGKEMISKVVITSSKAKDNDLGLLYIDLGSLHDDEPIVCGDNVEYIPAEPVRTNSVKLATAQLAAYIKSVTIYAEKLNYKNYTTTTCYDPITTAIENNGEKAKSEWMKVIVNGQLYIIKNGVMYNVLGAMVK